MKVPLNWLKDYVAVPKKLHELTDQLTAIGHMQDKPPQAVAGDTVLDLEIRQNRSDCLAMIGVAREYSAVSGAKVTLPEGLNKELPKLSKDSFITIKHPDACYRFHALRIEGIKIAPSPKWLSDRLEAYGIRSINNLVDITNFVMVEVGEPLHAFDVRHVSGEIVVRLAKADETVQVIGDREVKLDPSDIVITDKKGVLAMGGLIGGVASAVSDDTTEIILEAATYRQSHIRRSSLRHSLRTEASLRHEKFLHPELTEVALKRALQLIEELCGGKVVAHYDAYPKPVKEQRVSLSMARLHQLGGVEISESQAEKILTRLMITVAKKTKDGFEVVIPYFRTDLDQEEDIIEEVLRIYGYDRIPDRLPNAAVPKDIQSESYALEEQIRDILVAAGFDEQITEPLTRETVKKSDAVMLQNSLNSEKTMLRTTLKNQLLQALSYQRKFRKTESSLFELGKVYSKGKNQYCEDKILAGVMSGPSVTFFHIKGVLEVLFEQLGYEYNSSIITYSELGDTTFYFELPVAALLASKRHEVSSIKTAFSHILYQDLSLSVPEKTAVGEVMATVKKASSLVHKVSLGEYPRPLNDGRKSAFIRIQFHSGTKQLSAQDVEPVQKKIVDALRERYDAALR